MINLVNNHQRPDYLTINEDQYWDYTLISDHSDGAMNSEALNPISYIDFSDSGCWVSDFNTVECGEYVKPVVKSCTSWTGAVVSAKTLDHYGLVGVDNGGIKFDKMSSSFTEDDFEEIFIGDKGVFNLPQDSAFVVSAVNGNTEIYDYSVWRENKYCYGFNGGFFQGFFKTEACKYQVLPDNLNEYDWNFEFLLKPHDFNYITHPTFQNSNTDKEEKGYHTLNDKYPQNKGMFFYLGTRAENKWWKYYNQSETETENENVISENNSLTVSYWKTLVTSDGRYAMCGKDFHVLSQLDYEYEYDPETDAPKKDIDYYEEKSTISLTGDGKSFVETENKFLFFDRTPTGMTIHNFKEGTRYVFKPEGHYFSDNAFLLFNRTPSGMLVNDFLNMEEKDIETYRKMYMTPYKLTEDIFNNSIGFQITEDGKIGFKSIVRDCEGNVYKTESGFTNPGIVKYDEWNSILIKMFRISASKMRIHIYVNGYLKYVSSELEMLNLRPLNESYAKQEGVPYCISIGGGTQGLCDVIYPEYKAPPQYVFPIEKEFAGTFCGYIKHFKFYEGLLPYRFIRKTQKTSIRTINSI